MWLLMFYAGYLLFQRLAPPREGVEVHANNNTLNPLNDSATE